MDREAAERLREQHVSDSQQQIDRLLQQLSAAESGFSNASTRRRLRPLEAELPRTARTKKEVAVFDHGVTLRPGNVGGALDSSEERAFEHMKGEAARARAKAKRDKARSAAEIKTGGGGGGSPGGSDAASIASASSSTRDDAYQSVLEDMGGVGGGGLLPSALSHEEVVTEMARFEQEMERASSGKPRFERTSDLLTFASSTSRRSSSACSYEGPYTPGYSYGPDEAYVVPRYDSPSFAMDLARQREERGEDDALMTISAEGRAQRKKDKADARRESRMRKEELQKDADKARIGFGLSTVELKERRKAQEAMDNLGFREQRDRAMMRFGPLARRVILVNLLAIVTQLLHLLDLYQAIQPSSSGSGGGGGGSGGSNSSNPFGEAARESFDNNGFIYTVCGIFGSCLSICSLTLMLSVIYFQGTTSAAIPPLCAQAVQLSAISGLLQQLSLVNVTLSMPELIARAGSGLSSPSSFRVLLSLVELVLTIVNPFNLIYNVTSNRRVVYGCILPMCKGNFLSGHVFTALASNIFLAASVLIYTSSRAALTIVAFTEGMDDADMLQGRSMLYPYFVAIGVGAQAVVNSFAYRYIAGKYAQHEDMSERLDEDIEATKHYFTRVKIQKGEPCVIRYLVTKSRLNGKRAIVQDDTPNVRTGLVTVSIHGEKEPMKLEEFNLEPVSAHGHLQSKEAQDEYVELKVADLRHRQLTLGQKVARIEKLYVVLTQMSLGLSLTFFLLLFTNATFGGNVLFQLSTSYLNRDAVTPSPLTTLEQNKTATQVLTVRLNQQRLLCDQWSQCMSGEDERPMFCGTCVVPPAYGYSTQLSFWSSGASFTEGNPFGGASLTWIIAFSAGFGTIGMLFTCTLMLKLRSKARQASCVGLLGFLIFGALGLAASTLPKMIYTNIGALDPGLCGAEDIDAITNGVQEVPTGCLSVVGAQFLSRFSSRSSTVAIACAYAATIVYLLESLVFKSNHILKRNPFAWARFELLISFCYTLAMSVIIFLFTYFFRDRVEEWDAVYRGVSQRAADDANTYGAEFPLFMNQTVSVEVQQALEVWYSRPISWAAVNGLLVVIQLLGIYFCQYGKLWGSKRVDTVVPARGLRVVIGLNALVMSVLYPFVTYLASYTVGVSTNIFQILSLPTTLQFLFGVQYACHTEIIPLSEPWIGGMSRGNHPAAVALKAFVLFLPYLLLIFMSISAAIMWTADPSRPDQADRVASAEMQFYGLLIALMLYVVIAANFVGKYVVKQSLTMLVIIRDALLLFCGIDVTRKKAGGVATDENDDGDDV